MGRTSFMDSGNACAFFFFFYIFTSARALLKMRVKKARVGLTIRLVWEAMVVHYLQECNETGRAFARSVCLGNLVSLCS